MKYKNTINALKIKYNTDNIRYLNEGSEGKIFVINDNIVTKVYEKGRFSFKEIQNLISNFQAIDGIIKPKNIDIIQINGEDYIIQTSKYMKNGNLYEFILENENNKDYCFPIAFWLTIDLFYIHQAGFVHYDLRPDNIIINNKGKPKIIDLTFSKRIINDKIIKVAFTKYTSPDLLQNQIIEEDLYGKQFIKNVKNSIKIKTSYKHDIYSLGIIFIEFFAKICIDSVNYKKFMLIGKRLSKVAEENNREIVDNLNMLINNKNFREKFVTLYGSDESKLKLLKLIKNMINIDLEKRPNIEEVLTEIKEIYLMVSENYEKYNINENEYFFNIKNKEKLFSKIVNIKDINFNEKEIEKMDKTTKKILKSFLELKEISDNFKNLAYNYLEDSNFFENNSVNIGVMSLEEQEIFKRIIKRINLLEEVKNNKKIIL